MPTFRRRDAFLYSVLRFSLFPSAFFQHGTHFFPKQWLQNPQTIGNDKIFHLLMNFKCVYVISSSSSFRFSNLFVFHMCSVWASLEQRQLTILFVDFLALVFNSYFQLFSFSLYLSISDSFFSRNRLFLGAPSNLDPESEQSTNPGNHRFEANII